MMFYVDSETLRSLGTAVNLAIIDASELRPQEAIRKLLNVSNGLNSLPKLEPGMESAIREQDAREDIGDTAVELAYEDLGV